MTRPPWIEEGRRRSGLFDQWTDVALWFFVGVALMATVAVAVIQIARWMV